MIEKKTEDDRRKREADRLETIKKNREEAEKQEAEQYQKRAS